MGQLLDALDPALLLPADAQALLERLSPVGRRIDAATALLAGRVAEWTVWATGGDRTPAQWLAKRTGTSVGQAIATLDTASGCGRCRRPPRR